jgi:hypothetical protein
MFQLCCGKLSHCNCKDNSSILTLPIKAVGAVVEAITPDNEDEENEETEDEE